MRELKQSTSVRLTPTQKTKLRQLAAMLQATPNTIMGMLVDNATVAKVERQEAISTLPTNNKTTLKLSGTGGFAEEPVFSPTESNLQERQPVSLLRKN